MRPACVVCGVVVLLAIATPADAQELQTPSWTRDNYPLELAKRPLMLPAGMYELRSGVMSDLVGSVTDDTRLRGRLDTIWAPFARAQIGFDIDMMVFPTDAFEVRDVTVWAEYNLIPQASFRLGTYVEVPAEVDPVSGEMNLSDARVGIRGGFPIKLHAGDRAALTMHPRYGVLAAGGDTQDLDVPFTLQLSPMPQISFYGSTGIRISDLGAFETGSLDEMTVTLNLPVVVGGVISPGNLFDLGGDVRVVDITSEKGRQERWVFVYLALRR